MGTVGEVSERRKTRWRLRAFCHLLAAAAVSACFSQGDDSADAQAEPSYRDVTAERRPLRIAVSASGVVRPIDRIELKSKASGEVIELPVEVGDAVSAGSLIAKLDQVEERSALTQAQADLDVAQAELELAEKNFERRRKLLEGNVISEEAQDQTALELAVAKGKRVQAASALERAEERLTDTVISAPVAGVILQKYVEQGQIIASGVSNVGGGTPITDIADMRAVHVEAGIDEIDVGKIAVGQDATVRAEAFPGQLYQGEVVRIAPEARVEQNVTLFDVVIQVENRDARLKSGMNASVEIVIVDEPEALVIPVAALREESRGTDLAAEPGAPVVLLKEDSGYAPREIRVGRSDARWVEVLEGLAEGDVLGIPMVSRLKEEHDQLDARMRSRPGFGSTGKRKSGGN